MTDNNPVIGEVHTEHPSSLQVREEFSGLRVWCGDQDHLVERLLRYSFPPGVILLTCPTTFGTQWYSEHLFVES